MPRLLHDGPGNAGERRISRKSRCSESRSAHRRTAQTRMIDFLTNRDFLVLMAKMLSIFGGVMTALAYTTLMERRVMAFVQMRPGPNRVGPMGLLQPLADGLKFLLKEQVVPTNANVLLYYAAPIISLVPALLSFSVIPFGPDLKITDLSVGLLFIFAITGLGIYGIVLG